MKICVPFGYLGMLLVIGWLSSTLGCSREDSIASKGERPRPVEKLRLSADVSSNLTASLPQIGGLAGYVGSKSCESCHQEEYASWHRSYHRTMTQIASADAIQADFRSVTLTNNGIRFALNQKSDEFWVRMERLSSTPTDGSAPEAFDARIGLVTGSHHMQVFWVGDDTHNCQIGFPFTWLIPERRWVPRNSTFIRPATLEHRPETWNFVCARCHATGSQPNLDRASLTWHTQVGELGISCEACHGPGQRHAQARSAEHAKATQPTLEALRTEIVHPKKIDPRRASQICGFCHSMKWWEPVEGWPNRGFSYRPGDDLEVTTPVMRPTELGKQPWLKKVFDNNPDIFRDFFWSDGMIRVSGREYNGLIESPCYRGGQFSCLSCHSLHHSEPDDQLARNRTDNRACTQCHERLQRASELAAHTHHGVESTGSQCFNCHMPHTTYGVLTAIRSHQISSPKVLDQLSTGRPNACNLCHLDKTLQWTSAQLTSWFGHPVPKLSSDQNKVADSVLLALSGDAGQRALLAWHFGWEPATQTVGKSWIPPVLATLLDDPYAAVRCVAERSLKRLGNFLPDNYDFTAAPDSRPSAQKSILERWSKEIQLVRDLNLPVQTLVRRNDGSARQDEFDRFVRQRNDRAVRLRE